MRTATFTIALIMCGVAALIGFAAMMGFDYPSASNLLLASHMQMIVIAIVGGAIVITVFGATSKEPAEKPKAEAPTAAAEKSDR